MKKLLLTLSVFAAMALPGKLSAQSFTVESDTVTQNVSGVAAVYNFIINNLHTPLRVKWHVIGTSFPADWRTAGAFGICDNSGCYSNSYPNWLWNDTTSSGTTFTSLPYSDTTSHGTFDLSLNLTGVSNGSHWVTINLTDAADPTSTKDVTFVINKVSASVASVRSVSDVALYPNPANNELNVIYDAAANIKSIAVCSIIGKVVGVYKVTDNTSANLQISNVPSGIYFLRLMNGGGEVVATKKFTRQ